MSDDDSRDTKTPDRQDASTHATVQTHLEQIDQLTRALIADLKHPQTEPTDLTETTRRELIRHCREIRAEASYVGLHAIGPEAAMPYDETHDAPATVYDGPMPGAFDRVRDRRRELDRSDDDRSDDRKNSDRPDTDHADDRPDDGTNADGGETDE